MDKEILEGNTIIAKFMGAKKRWFEFRGYHDASAIRDEPNPHLPMNQENGPYKKANKWYQHYKWQMNEKDTSGQFDTWLQYHSSLDWLKPVIDKITDIGVDPAPEDPAETNERAGKVASLQVCVSIERVWGEVVGFIKWYNSNQPQQ